MSVCGIRRMINKLLIGLSSILCLTLMIACNPSPVEEQTEVASVIPANVSYEVLNTDIIPDIKRSLDIRLNKKVSEDVLRAIALELKSSDSNDYEHTFICYYLPDMTVGAGAWATTHFDPTLEINIYGLTVQEEQELIAEPTPSNVEIIGIWLDELTGTRIIFYQEDDMIFMEWQFKDGSSLKEEMIKSSSPLGQRFDKKEGSDYGDHWIIDQDGNLQIRDDFGVISTAQKVQ
jgi:hypothetical protein